MICVSVSDDMHRSLTGASVRCLPFVSPRCHSNQISPNPPSALPHAKLSSLHPKAGNVLDRHPHLLRDLFTLTQQLFQENPPAYGGGAGGAAMITERKRAWVAQRVAELAEVVGCMVIAAYHRYRVSAIRPL